MRIAITVPEEHVSPEVVNPALEAVTKLDERLIRAGQSPTSKQLVQQGAVWRPEPPGDERFDHGGTIASRGWGDCDDWAPLHAATLRASGEDPGAKAIVYQSGPTTYHAVVKRSNGQIDDPSVAAGMRSRRNAIAGEASSSSVALSQPDAGEVYPGAPVPMLRPLSLHCGPQFAVRRVVGGFEARCDIPIVGSQMHPVECGGRVGSVPYSLAFTSQGRHPAEAVNGAIEGAIDCAECSGFAGEDDFHRMLALQGMLCGVPPRDMAHHLAGVCGPELARTHVIGAADIARRFYARHRRR